MSVGFWTNGEHPNVFKCADFSTGICCADCHEHNFVIVLYPWSVYSEGKREKMPDLSMGLRAEVCCGQFHVIRQLPREWWIRRYCARQKWSEEDAERLVKATPETYIRISGELASKYFQAFGGGAKGASYSRTTSSRTIQKSSRSRPAKEECPECGSDWDGVACDDCGHSD